MPSDIVQTVDCSLTNNLNLKNSSKRPPLTSLTTLQLIETVALILEEMIEERFGNFSDVSEIPLKTPFHAQKLPSISIKAYLQRFAENSKCQDNAFILALIYLDRVGDLIEGFSLDSFNVHRMILICLVLACKYNDDYYYKNSYYSKIGGVKTEEFNHLEQEFLLNYIEFSLYVDPKTYSDYYQDLVSFYQDKTEETEAS